MTIPNHGKRLAIKVAVIQLAATGVAAIVFLLLHGGGAARSAVAGGLIIAIGTLVFAWRFFAQADSAAAVLGGFYAGEIFKWIWVIGALALALTRGGFKALPMMVGLISAQVGFWLAIGLSERTKVTRGKVDG